MPALKLSKPACGTANNFGVSLFKRCRNYKTAAAAASKMAGLLSYSQGRVTKRWLLSKHPVTLIQHIHRNKLLPFGGLFSSTY